jgi:hypothetical protein
MKTVFQRLQPQKKFHFALAPKLNFPSLHPDVANLSFPHIERLIGFYDRATQELLCGEHLLAF